MFATVLHLGLPPVLSCPEALEPAFADGPIPYPRVNLASAKGENMPWFPTGCTTLADAGTIFFELDWLGKRSGIQKFSDRARLIVTTLGAHASVRIGTGDPCSLAKNRPGVGSDSWFEMLIKTGLRPELTDAFARQVEWGSLDPTRRGGHLLCFWPGLMSDQLASFAPSLRHRCVDMATRGCHVFPEAAEMMFHLGIDTENARGAFETCRKQFGYGDPEQHSWIAAETIKYLYGMVHPGGVVSTEGHVRLDGKCELGCDVD